MTTRFECQTCKTIFEAEGRKVEYNSPVYGPCWKVIADCPSCQGESNEYKQPKIKKDNPDAMPSCAAGCKSCCGR